MEVSKDKLKLALKIASETPDVNMEDLMELIGVNEMERPPKATKSNKLWTKEEKQQLAKLYNEGYTYEQIGKMLNRSASGVNKQLTNIRNANQNQTESYRHRKIRELLERHRNNMDSIQPLEYTQLAKEICMKRDECISMVYDVWKEGKA